MAKIAHITKKLLKAGFEPKADEYRTLFVRGDVTIGLQFNHGSDECWTLYSWEGENTSDSMTDYFCESWHDNVKQALSFVDRSAQVSA